VDLLGLPHYCTGKTPKMTQQRTINLDLWENKGIFEEINLQIENFLHLFSEIANIVSQDRLKLIHPNSKGIKISKGNQLNQCPYQVLDMIRDFDPETGFNIRLLNWFGHGMIISIHYAPAIAIRFQKTIESLSNEFYLSKTSSPWNYSDFTKNLSPVEDLDVANHLSEFNHLQLYRFIKIDECSEKTLSILMRELEIIIDNHSE